MAFGIPWENADGTITTPTYPVLTWLWNSTKISVITSVLVLMLSTTGAYAFARLRLRLSRTCYRP